MKLRKTIIALMALLVAAMAMLPCVSAVDDNDEKELLMLIENNAVPQEIAQKQAFSALQDFAGSGASGGEDTWLQGEVNPDPMVIYDVNGTKLFYLFAIEDKQQKTGEIKIAANKLVGNTLYTIGPQKNILDISVLEQKARSEAERYAKTGTPVSTKLVCYSYPKIGMMAEYTDDQTNTAQKLIIDAYDYVIIPDRSPRYEGDRGIVPFFDERTLERKTELIDSWMRSDRGISDTVNASISSSKTSPKIPVPDAGNSVIPASNSPPVLDIFTPRENEVIQNDVVPPHLWISGEVKNLSRIQSITITSSEGLTDCSNESSFECSVKVRNGQNRINITVTDWTGNRVSITRDFTVISGGITQPPRITISGRITSADGHPIEDAVIRLESDTVPVTTESGTDGSYRISNAYGYTQKICVEKTGYTNVTKEVTFDRNLNTLDFTLVPATRPAYGFSTVLCLVVLMGIVLTIVYRNNSL